MLADTSVTLDEDGTLTVDALASAHDVDGDPLTLELAEAPLNGSLTLLADGRYTYAPSANFHGTDTFRLRVGDGQAYSAVATVSVTVQSVNDAPTAFDSLAIGEEDQALMLAWSDFDVADVDGDALSVRISTLPADGVLQRKTQVGGVDVWLDVVAGDSFTQAEIEAGLLRFVPDADVTCPVSSGQ